MKPQPALLIEISSERLDDTALLAQARQGSEAAVRGLVSRHNQRLFRVARAILRDDAEAEDVVQETYAKAFTALHSFRGDALLSTWLTRIALNEAIARLRRRRPTTDLAVIDETQGSVVMFPMKSASPEAEAGRSQVRALLERAVDELPEAFRIVFIMREIEEMSTEETASHLSLKIETVKTRLHRARKLMRATIEQRLASAFSELYPFKGKRCAGMADRVIQDLRQRR